MTESSSAAKPAVINPEASKADPPQRLDEVVKTVQMEVVSGRVVAHERGRGFNPYDNRGAPPDVWSERRRA